MRFSVSEYVRWEDIDAAGIINYQAYLRFFGLAEVELFRSCGLPYRTLFDDLGPKLLISSARPAEPGRALYGVDPESTREQLVNPSPASRRHSSSPRSGSRSQARAYFQLR